MNKSAGKGVKYWKRDEILEKGEVLVRDKVLENTSDKSRKCIVNA